MHALSHALVLVLILAAAPRTATLDPLHLDIDKAGALEQSGYTYLCKSVIDEQTMVVGGAWSDRSERGYLPPFVVKGLPTRGFTDNKEISDKLKGTFKVTGTMKIAGESPGTTRTVYVLELQK